MPDSAEYVAAMTLARTTGRNEFGTPVDHKVCPACGFEFTVCPPSDTFGDHCLGPLCPSYDIERDVDYLMLDHTLRRDDDA